MMVWTIMSASALGVLVWRHPLAEVAIKAAAPIGAVFTALAGGSFGKLATRLRVVRHDGSGRPVSLLRALGRSVLVALLVPPLLTFDGRGLHDVAAGTRTVTL